MALTVPFKVKVGKHGNSLRVTIPEQIADYQNIQEGDTLIITAPDDKTIVIRKEA